VHEALLETAEEAELQSTSDGDNEISTSSEATPASAPTARRVVTCVPSHGTADQISAQLVAEYLSTNKYESHAASDAALCSEVLQQVGEIKPDVVLISTIAPHVGSHARYLCKRLRLRFPNTPVIVGLWMEDGDKLPLNSAVKSAGWQAVVRDFSELTAWLENRSVPTPSAVAQKPPSATAG
jgi:hypothetical protein